MMLLVPSRKRRQTAGLDLAPIKGFGVLQRETPLSKSSCSRSKTAKSVATNLQTLVKLRDQIP